MDLKDLKKGFEGEQFVRNLLLKKGHFIGQMDLISLSKDGKVYLYEIKHQERFNAPPFDGHGLPPNQMKFRLKIAKLTGMIPVLVIVEPFPDLWGKRNVFIQRLDILNDLPDELKFVSKTGKRIIFHIDAFVHKYL